MPIRRRAWLTREGWYYLAVLAFIIGGAVLRSVNLLVILAGMMIAPLLFNWRLVMASLTGLNIRRKLPRQILAGEPLTVEIQVQNDRWWMSTWLLRVEDWIKRRESGVGSQESGVGSQESGVGSRGSGVRRQKWRWFRSDATRVEALVGHVAAGGSGVGTYRVTLHRRGRYRFGPLRASTRFPLGLVSGQITLPERGELIVSPRLGRLLPAWANLLEAERVGEERRHPQRGLSEGDYYGIRPWQSGDSLRWVHWRTTAKMARPMVRQFERRRSRDVAIVLDAWLPPQATERDEGLAELAISFAATALHDISTRGHSRLTIAIAGREPRCHSGPASAVFCEALLGELAELALGDDVSVSAAMQRAIETAPRGARVIVISPRAAGDRSLVENVAELTIDPEDVLWIDVGGEIASLFCLTE